MFEMIKKAKGLLSVYNKGQQVVDAVFLKKTQLTANLLSGFLVAAVAALKAFNVNIPLDDAQLVKLAEGLFVVLGLFNTHATVASTDKIGLSVKSDPFDEGDTASHTNLPQISPEPASTTVQSESDPLAGLDTSYVG